MTKRRRGAAGDRMRSPFELPPGTAVAWHPAPTGPIRVVASGDERDEPVVLFVHGLGGCAEHWAPLFHRLVREGVRCAAVDLPGHGQSEWGDDASLDSLSGAVAAAADALDLRSFVLVAHSLGASAALDYAGKHPRRVAGLLLLDPNGDLTHIPKSDRESLDRALQDDAHAELEGHFRQFLGPSRDEVAQRVLADLRRTPQAVLRHTYFAGLDDSPLAGLDRYRRAGGRVASVVTPWNDLPYSLHRLRPELPTRLAEGTGHWLMLDDPEGVAEMLTEFTAQVGAVN
ncbi:MAG: alpha/beta hydrolase [Thermoanaerobaculia bacterium]|nr:alpha/beta hydrolase [Thermoanaerobaculia bacterium]